MTQSGTTALAAKNLNRQFIGIDISPEYCEMAQQRLDKKNMMNGGNVTRN